MLSTSIKLKDTYSFKPFNFFSILPTIAKYYFQCRKQLQEFKLSVSNNKFYYLNKTIRLFTLFRD